MDPEICLPGAGAPDLVHADVERGDRGGGREGCALGEGEGLRVAVRWEGVGFDGGGVGGGGGGACRG